MAQAKRVAHPAAPTASVVEVLNLKLPHHSASTCKSNAEVTAPLQFIGGNGGTQHQVRGWEQGKLVTKLRIYSGYWQIKAVRIWLSGDGDNEYKQFGNPDHTQYKEFAFQDGERITKMSLWGNGAGTRAGWIYFETNKGNCFDYGMHGWPKKTEYTVDVGSGILVGAIYNSGSDIDAHGYYFLSSSVTSTQMTDVRYPTLQFDSHQITPTVLDNYKQTNTSSGPISWSFGSSQEVRTEQTWSFAVGNTFSVHASIKAAVPKVVEVEGKFGWELSTVSTHALKEERKHGLNWSAIGTLQPGESIELVALTREGKLSVPFNSTMVVTLKNGANYNFPLSGTYDGLCYTSVEVTNASTLARLNAKVRPYVRP